VGSKELFEAQVRKPVHNFLVATALGAFGAPFMATHANAAVVCNDVGDCWRVKGKHHIRTV
jgi:hypothetical protein